MSNEQMIIDYATKDVNIDTKKELQGDFNILKQSARNFINGVRAAIAEIAKTNTEIKTKRKYSITSIYDAMKRSTELTQKIVTLQFQFEENFNNFLGRTIGIIWKDEKTGQLYYGSEVQAAEVYERGTSKKGGRSSVNTVDANELIKFEDYIKTLSGFGRRIYEHQRKYKSLEAEVTTRWNWNNDPNNRYYNIPSESKKGKITYPYRNTFYWKDGDNWDHSRKINKGHITETYVDLMMSDDSVLTIVPPGTSENSIKQYWEYMMNHNLNNISGIVQGDVILAGQELQQFAVKEGQFSTAAVGPYLTTAYLILNFSEFDIKEILQTKNLSQLGKNISTRADILAKTEANNTIKAGLIENMKLITETI